MTTRPRRTAIAAMTLLATLGLSGQSRAAGEGEGKGEVNIYSYRQPELIAPLLKAFEAETGIRTNVLFLDKGLAERIAAEGRNSPADVIMTVDIGRLDEARAKGITAPVDDATIEANIPAQYRHADGHWFALTTRGRVVYASKARVPENEITYEDLADPKWKGRICTRSAQHDYNIGLIASMIAHHGEAETETWLAGLRDNLATRPNGNDRSQAQAIFSGACDIALGNTYYVGLMLTNEKEPEQKDWANSMKVLFPNAGDRGTHVNVSGMALAKHAPNRDNALKLMAFLSSPEAQEIYAEQVFEYPVGLGAAASEIVKGFGTLKPDTLALEDVAKNRKLASELVDRTAFNAGPQG